MKQYLILFACLLLAGPCYCWGFFGHRKINLYAIFLLPPEMIAFYKPHADFLVEHAVDPDKRRYMVAAEGPRHYIDIDHYGTYPYEKLPRRWNDAVESIGADSLQAHGIVPWWIQTMLGRLTQAFRDKHAPLILKYSAELGHYIADAHVPLHTSSNHNGQKTDQKGIHGFWESRIPELLADKEWDFFIGRATYIPDPLRYTWDRVLESAAASDSVLRIEKQLSKIFPPDRKYAFEERNGIWLRQYSSAYCIRYNNLLRGMIERRMRQSIYSIASFWYTAWVNAGQPDLALLDNIELSEDDKKAFEALNQAWQKAGSREHD